MTKNSSGVKSQSLTAALSISFLALFSGTAVHCAARELPTRAVAVPGTELLDRAGASLMSDSQILTTLSLLLFFAVMGCLTAIVIALWQRNRKAHFQSLYRAETGLHASKERYTITLKAIGDAVISTDPQGRVEFMNPIAVELTGWSAKEAIGKPLEEVFRIVNEETRGTVENPVTKVLRNGAVVGLANHTQLISKTGRETPIADSAAPIKDEQGEITGVVLVFRDQSD
jgi:two-component system cell cycle sensor histidine kinase/response regulator CckA